VLLKRVSVVQWLTGELELNGAVSWEMTARITAQLPIQECPGYLQSVIGGVGVYHLGVGGSCK
jgi:hypothetical protein